jgi:ATP-dependent exoDNAse (exonuclease V) alpha subunit
MLEELMLNTGCRKLKLNARHSCAAAKCKPADTYRGLETEIMVAIGARVMITNNIWTEMGLTNGAFGVVRHIIFAANVGPPNLPEAIIVEMDEPYSGPCLPGLPRHVVIAPVSISDPNCMSHSREQFPLTLAWAITICKCQGKF